MSQKAQTSHSSEDEKNLATANHWLVWVVAAMVVLMGGAFMADRLLQPENFQFDEIVIGGSPDRVDVDALQTELQIALGGNYFSVDLVNVKAVVDSFPWISHVSVRRKWPATLMVMLTEHQIVARWGKDRWLTVAGKIVDLPVETQLELPKLSGVEQHAGEVWQMYQGWNNAFNRVGLNMQKLHYSGGQLWVGELTSLSLPKVSTDGSAIAVSSPITQMQREGFEIVVHQSNADEQISSLIRSLTGRLRERVQTIDRVDLRYPHGFAVRWKETAEGLETSSAKLAKVKTNS